MKKLFDLLTMSVFAVMLPAGVALMSCSSDDPVDPEYGSEDPDGEGTITEGDTLRMVDLGLSVYWADRNVGADSPYAAGDYVGSDGMDDVNISNLVRYVTGKTGRNYWKIPEWKHVEELYDHCTFEEMLVDDGRVKVMHVTGPNGNSIDLPMAGHEYMNDYSYVNSVGYYIYRREYYNMAGKWCIYSGIRDNWLYSCSCPVRPIAYKSDTVAWEDYFGEVPDADEAVDLGLSVKWAPWNIGSDRPEIYGGFYGWGDPTGKLHSEDPDDYPVRGESGNLIITDLAFVKWGGNWQTPTREQMDELLTKCEWEWTLLTGTSGYRVTGPNGNSIFLPAGGYREGEARNNRETAGWYWTKTRERGKYGDMRYFSLFFSESSTMMYDMGDPYLGKSIRPVYNEE